MSKFQMELDKISLTSTERELVNSKLKAVLLEELIKIAPANISKFDINELRELIDDRFILGIKISRHD